MERGPLASRVNSSIEGIVWPGIPAPNGAALLAILFQLEQSQWWAPDQILLHQRDQLQALLQHARTHVPLYRERLRDVLDLANVENWLGVWQSIEPLTR